MSTAIDFAANVDGTFVLSIEDDQTGQGVHAGMSATEAFALMAAMMTVIGQYVETGIASRTKRANKPEPTLFVPSRKIIN